ncbi:transcription factor bHLH118-like isoform X2 [Chenopodium quinoa]|uniref:transcription factor bHLH118-like isoform X2 n=1 Tax=Chenopodium quinoa TaxID=63459 RepID=UPI000B77C590|nr:transcription factor bHLH118-like isoform X2 [Chenopodium quinoa]
MDQNLPTSLDPFDFDPNSLDDDLMQLINNAFPQTPQNHDVQAVLNTSTENHQFTISNSSFYSSAHASPPAPTPTPAPAPAPAPVPSKDEARKKKAKAVEIERKRRQEMSSLYQELQSVLPPGLFKRRIVTSDLLQVTTNHIKKMEKGIKGLNDKRDELMRMMKSAVGSSTNSNTSKQKQNHYVTVKPCKDGLIEIVVSTSAMDDDDHENNNRGFSLSKILRLLDEEGLNVINCSLARIDSNLVHNIQVQVDDGRSIDLCLLRQTLTDHS